MSERYRQPPTGPRSSRDFSHSSSHSSRGAKGRPRAPRQRRKFGDKPKNDKFESKDDRDARSFSSVARPMRSTDINGGDVKRDTSTTARDYTNAQSDSSKFRSTRERDFDDRRGDQREYRSQRNYNDYKDYRDKSYKEDFRTTRDDSKEAKSNDAKADYRTGELPKESDYRDARDLNRDFKGKPGNGYAKNGPPRGVPSGPKGGRRGKEKDFRSDTRGVKRPPPAEARSFRKKQAKDDIKPSQIYSIKTIKKNDAYRTVQQVGEGTYGKVYKAVNTGTDEYVAMKKLRLESEREGFPITALREIKLLQSFHHPNVVGLLEMMVDRNQIFMIMDYMDHDLTGLLTHPDLKLEEQHKKYLFKQLMEGLDYLHKKRIIHRDIKGSNILVDNVGRLKIADFGLARPMKILRDGESPDYTNRVITIWYRPPELLLGATDYGREVDIWGVGCLLMELYQKHAVFQGFDEIGQLTKIFSVMGTPGLEDWPEIDNLPWFEMLKPKVNLANRFRKMYAQYMTPSSFDLAEKLLCMNPKSRLSAGEALKHTYFSEDPKPEPLTFLKDVQGEWHEFETKKRRRAERKQRELMARAGRDTASTDGSLAREDPKEKDSIMDS